MNPLKLPYGLADFYKIISQSYFYQDSTDSIPLLEQAGDQLLLLRPRRFGKSLLLSMLENYYDLAKAEQFETLFGHLAIGQNPTPLHNRYFVLKWDFSAIAAHGELAAIERAVHEHINLCIEEFACKYQAQLSHAIHIHADNALASWRSLLTAIQQTPYKLYLLIDEYDNFANEVLMAQKEHYGQLLHGEGLLKTVFKNIKAAASGWGLDRVFITGVSPVVMSDMTSGYNVATNVYLETELNDLCGFSEAEVQALLAQVVEDPAEAQRALAVMRTFYNGYRFAVRAEESVYNPTLSLYFMRALQKHRHYPDNLLDENLAMDRNKLHYIAQLPGGEEILVDALGEQESLAVWQLSERFGVADVLEGVKDRTFMVSLLYYFGVLTLQGITPFGEYRLQIPNLVARKLYLERLQELYLPHYDDLDEAQRVIKRFCQTGDVQPLCKFIEHRHFKILSNRDYRFSNELIIKVAFMTLLYNDHLYMMVSEIETQRRYVDLSLIVRPDKRQYRALDLVLEFKYLALPDLGLTASQLRALDEEALLALPKVAKKLAEAEQQGGEYLDALQQQYPQAKLHGFAILALGFERLLWRRVSSVSQ